MYQAPRYFKSGVRRTLALSTASLANDDEKKKALHVPVPHYNLGLRHHLVARPRLRFTRREVDEVTRVVFGPGPHKLGQGLSPTPLQSPIDEEPVEIPSPGSDTEPGLPVLRLHENQRINTAIVQMASNLLEKPEVQESLAEELARWELIEIPGGAAVPILKADSETLKLAQCLQQLPPVTPTTACLRVSPSSPDGETTPMLAVSPGPIPESKSALADPAQALLALSLGQGMAGGAGPRKEGEAEISSPSSAPASARKEGEQTKDDKKRKHHKRGSHKQEESSGLIARIARWIKATIFGVLPEKEKRKSGKKHKQEEPVERKAGVAHEDDGLVMEQLDEEIEEQQQRQQSEKDAEKGFPWAQAAVGVALGILVLLVFRRSNPGQFMKLVALLKRS